MVTAQVQLRPSKELSNLCHLSKNLCNPANFQYRQFYFHLGKFLSYCDLNAILKERACYKALPAQTSQQILKLVIKNWKSYFRANKAFKQNPSKFAGTPACRGIRRRMARALQFSRIKMLG